MSGHHRSTSLPPTPHPNETKVEEKLHSINSTVSSPSATIGTVCDSLRRLGDVYSCINVIICLHSNQVHRKRLEEEMERSLEVLDLCNAMQESFTDLKMTIQELHMALNRGHGAVVQAKVQCYIRLVKKAKLHLKKSGNKSASDEDGRLVSLLTTARGITVSVVKSAVELLSKQMATWLFLLWIAETRQLYWTSSRTHPNVEEPAENQTNYSSQQHETCIAFPSIIFHDHVSRSEIKLNTRAV